MDQNKLLECIEFFSKLKVIERDITTEEELKNNQKVVIVDYFFNDIKHTTNKLYYKNILNQNAVKNPKNIVKYFGDDVYWLDIDVHDWAKGSGEAELEKIIIDDIAPENDLDFKVLLKKVANNNKTGFLQLITADGKPGQYHHNFENNNHWHDIITLIKEVIKNKGKKIPKQFFSRLVFRWDGDKNTVRERSSLAREVEHKGRAFIDELYSNINSIQTQLSKMELSKILLNKKQIILQGPPGTGKTYTAEKLAKELVAFNDKEELNDDFVKNMLNEDDSIESIANNGRTEYKIKNISNKDCEFYNNTTGYKITYNSIIISIKDKLWESNDRTNGTYPYTDAIAKYVYNKIIKKEQKLDENIKLIQFHPAYSYEDFVRGITAKSKDGVIEYITENKILAKFAKKALKNFNDSNKEQIEVSKEKWVAEQFEKFIDFISDEMEKNEKIEITKSVNIIKLDEDAFRYKGLVGWSENGNRMLFEDIKQAYLDGNNDRQDVKHNQNLSGLAHHHASYYIRLLDLFKNFLKDNKLDFVANISEKEELKNYVLIIDEINRANLPAVLGELIYALEYRGKKVESMYEIDGENSLIIPPNLYIIGTMNTADRSVGHIDYAIRRRFAFVDILPNAEVIINPSSKALFEEISKLFYSKDTLASDFKAAQVQLGHSYFMVKDDAELQLKAKYEIVPILEEYLKDGILLEKAEKTILELKERFDN
ncbi:AAA family ATPase [Flavobacterium restrictum]|nr:AAA family ATPase [Flavobacterium restrictum]